MVRDECNFCFSFCIFFVFLPFDPLNRPGKKKFKKNKKNPGDIIILHMHTKNYDQVMYVPETRCAMDGQTD